MRMPIAVQVKSFDVHTLQADVARVRADFVRYLSEVPMKSRESKHGLMGPIGKLISQLKSGGRDSDQLKGYILNVDRATRNSFRRAKKISPECLEALERGINKTCELLERVPLTAHSEILDQLDYGLYFDLRKAEVMRKEERRQAWITTLRDKYETEAKLSEAWGEEISSFDELYLPRKAEGSKAKKATMKQQDITAFWESQGATVELDEEEED